MVKELYEKICERTETRTNLIALKQEIKKEDGKRALAYLLGGDYSEFVKLLWEEDAKVRKNTALILGEMECEDMLDELWNAYERENQLFVKSSYLKAMAAYDCTQFLTKIRGRIHQLTKEYPQENQEKHIREELKELQNILLAYDKPGKHKFQGVQRECEVILLTNREHREVTKQQLGEKKMILLAGGIRVKTSEIKELFSIRTFSEMLFPIPGLTLLNQEPETAAIELANSQLMNFLEESHKGEPPFYFRVDVRGKMAQEEKTAFIRKFSARLERETDRRLINTPSAYELELRLLEKKEGGFVPMMKLHTLPDRRFIYRRQVLAASIHPANAALIMELLRPWLTEGAQVLDPFCGVGTMLIERAKVMEANPLYGIDIFPDAIEKARENTKAAGMIINYINRNCLDFQHEYRFDEIITNLPTVTRSKGVEEITELYEAFLTKTGELLKTDGIIAMYTTEESILSHALRRNSSLKLVKKWSIREKEGSVLYLLRRTED